MRAYKAVGCLRSRPARAIGNLAANTHSKPASYVLHQSRRPTRQGRININQCPTQQVMSFEYAAGGFKVHARSTDRVPLASLLVRASSSSSIESTPQERKQEPTQQRNEEEQRQESNAAAYKARPAGLVMVKERSVSEWVTLEHMDSSAWPFGTQQWSRAVMSYSGSVLTWGGAGGMVSTMALMRATGGDIFASGPPAFLWVLVSGGLFSAVGHMRGVASMNQAVLVDNNLIVSALHKSLVALDVVEPLEPPTPDMTKEERIKLSTTAPRMDVLKLANVQDSLTEHVLKQAQALTSPHMNSVLNRVPLSLALAELRPLLSDALATMVHIAQSNAQARDCTVIPARSAYAYVERTVATRFQDAKSKRTTPILFAWTLVAVLGVTGFMGYALYRSRM